MYVFDGTTFPDDRGADQAHDVDDDDDDSDGYDDGEDDDDSDGYDVGEDDDDDGMAWFPDNTPRV